MNSNTSSEPPIIGGLFALGDETAALSGATVLPEFLQGRAARFVNARSALWWLIGQLNPRQVWLPAYLCPSLVQAVAATPAPLEYYAFGDDSPADMLPQPDDIVLAIDYFGFPWKSDRSSAWLTEAAQRGAWIVRDASQALLNPITEQPHLFHLFSPRKFVGVPDGGVLRFPEDFPTTLPSLAAPAKDWLDQAVAAGRRRRDYDLHGGERDWFGMYQRAEAGQPLGAIGMSGITTQLLEQAFAYPAIAARRRANYTYLLTELSHLALYPELPDTIVPLGFPVACEPRDALRQKLFAANIFPPVHWPLPAEVTARFPAAHRMSQRIMTLPCDQRYGEADMARMVQEIKKNL